jgi:hypothetical protein
MKQKNAEIELLTLAEMTEMLREKGEKVCNENGLGHFSLECKIGDRVLDEECISAIVKENMNAGTREKCIAKTVNEILSLDVLYLEVNGSNTTCYYVEKGGVQQKTFSQRLKAIYKLLPKDLFVRISGRCVINRKHVIESTEEVVKFDIGEPKEWGDTFKSWDVRYGMPIPNQVKL